MTIKQATSWLSQPGIVAMIHDPTTRRALRVAVKALEQLPSAQLGTNLAEVGTDLISRQAALDALDEQTALCDKALKSFGISMKDEYAVKVEKASLVAFRERLEYLPPAQPVPCEDAVSREAVLDALRTCYDTETITYDNGDEYIHYNDAVGEIEQLPPEQLQYWQQCMLAWMPPAQPEQLEIINCKDCAKHNKGVGDFEVLPDGKRSWIWKDQACPLVSWRGKAQGHEFDYQYCACAERRTDERSD